ncbi:hypothetical protein J2S17_000066 [Cytobacillus purgationiresistens]|uniref:Uncharacterized protein n=1 Tax=Cytobacillus purgationiresistens TaxID=863449 RepID=A0ABU0AAC2_9BACI|nr:hypothetical protein [Cytobacillus purgationiresistens]
MITAIIVERISLMITGKRFFLPGSNGDTPQLVSF